MLLPLQVVAAHFPVSASGRWKGGFIIHPYETAVLTASILSPMSEFIFDHVVVTILHISHCHPHILAVEMVCADADFLVQLTGSGRTQLRLLRTHKFLSQCKRLHCRHCPRNIISFIFQNQNSV